MSGKTGKKTKKTPLKSRGVKKVLKNENFELVPLKRFRLALESQSNPKYSPKMMTQETLIRLGWHTKIDPNTILCLKADSNYTEVYLIDGNRILSATTLGSLAKRLPAGQFIRANRSVLINLDFMTEYQRRGKAITLNNNEVIQVSRRRSKQVAKSINTQ